MPSKRTRTSSYTEHGRLSEILVAGMFRAAERLYRTDPWACVNGAEPLRLDIPHLSARELCIAVIDVPGLLGLLILRSVEDMEGHLEQNRRDFAAEAAGRPYDETNAIRSETLFLLFERATDLPVSMRREALKWGWPVASRDSYPVVERRDAESNLVPLTDRDLLIAEFAADVTATFVIRHQDHLALGQPHRCRRSEEYLAQGYSSAIVTVPYDAPSLADRKSLGPSLRLAQIQVPPERPGRSPSRRPSPE